MTKAVSVGTIAVLFNTFLGTTAMKRWIKRSLFALFGASVLVAGLSACGHRSHDFATQLSAEEYAQKRDKMVDKAASRLDLNEDQKKRLAVLGDKLYEQRTALVGQTKDPRADLKALVAGDKFDAARAQSLVSEKTAALNSKSPEVIAAMADFYNSLNPAQQQKVREYMEGRGRWYHRG
jgi:Spy/CpxP family protein refolding chaperone